MQKLHFTKPQLNCRAGVHRRYGDGISAVSCKTSSRVLKAIYLIINMLTFSSILNH